MFDGICGFFFNPLNAELNPVRHLLALVGARHIVHVSRIRVNLENNGMNHRKIAVSSYEVSCEP